MLLGDRIKELRKLNQMTQDMVASDLNVSRQAVAKWESNLSYPSTENIIKLSSLFKVSVQDLLMLDTTHNNEINNSLIILVQAEKKRQLRNDNLKQLTKQTFKICILYVLLFILYRLVFVKFGNFDYVFTGVLDLGLLWICFIYTVIASLCCSEKTGYYTLVGIITGIMTGNIIGRISVSKSVLHFNIGWIPFLIVVIMTSSIGFILYLVNNKRDASNLKILSVKAKRIVNVIIALFLFVSIIISGWKISWQLLFNRGAEAGYSAGYRQGLEDKEFGLNINKQLSESIIPDKYNQGTSRSGFFLYWPTGYDDGFKGK